jgi:hypothetical protein
MSAEIIAFPEGRYLTPREIDSHRRSGEPDVSFPDLANLFEAFLHQHGLVLGDAFIRSALDLAKRQARERLR